MKNLLLFYFNKMIMLQLIINSIRNKFELLLSIIGDKIDSLKIREKKLDVTFPTNQFFIQEY